MTNAPPADKTVVLATYSNRQDAEMARVRLAGLGPAEGFLGVTGLS